jgi:three-Cys-motif partner protein
MGKTSFHKEPYDAGTLTKLAIFESYAEAWIPVFTSQLEPSFKEIHIYDFFSGPGTDSEGNFGSPLLVLRKLKGYHSDGRLHGWSKVAIRLHFSDADQDKCDELATMVASPEWQIPGVLCSVRRLEFSDALTLHRQQLHDPSIPKLLIVDPFGVNDVTDDIFRRLVEFPRADFIFFLPSAILNRFRSHPAIKVKIEKPEDSYDVHRAAYEHFRALAPRDYFLGRFSIKKRRGNIYGLIFGSGHPLGIQKFLDVAWGKDTILGEANFDIDRERLSADEPMLDLPELRPRKIQAFESDLASMLRTGSVRNESDLIRCAIEAGMTLKHCAPVINALKHQGVIACDFTSPSIKNFRAPRPITFLKPSA